MPTISLPPRTEPTTVPRGGQTIDSTPSFALRAHVAVHRRSLSHQLADGADPRSSEQLALRASQLTSDRRRRTLARSLRRTVHEARHPAPRRVMFGLVRRAAVIDAADAIDVLVKRLHSPEPVAPEGVALVERMLSDGGWSPLYNDESPGALRQLVILATAALEPAVVR